MEGCAQTMKAAYDQVGCWLPTNNARRAGQFAELRTRACMRRVPGWWGRNWGVQTYALLSFPLPVGPWNAAEEMQLLSLALVWKIKLEAARVSMGFCSVSPFR